MKPLALFAGGLILCACGSSPATPRAATVAPPAIEPVATTRAAPLSTRISAQIAPAAESKETLLIARMLKRVEVAREIESKKGVPGVVLDRTALIARVKEHVAREMPAAAIHNEGLALQLFGFVPTEFDYEAAEYELLQDQLAGYFEPADGTMYMASDLGDDEADATLAHELVHALQDQRWDLETRSRYRPGDGDRSEAVSALAEGDATSAMFDVMIARTALGVNKTALDLPDDLFANQIVEGISQGPGAKAPHVMRSSLAAPYVYGTLFVHALRRRGGWAAVDRAWDDAPTTSEQILHVGKWIAHEAPMKVTAPTFETLGAGWTPADVDSEGELGARIAFEEWLAAPAAAEISSGWGGDRGVLVTNGDRAAFAWRLRYDADSTHGGTGAARAFPVLSRAFDKVLGPARIREGAFACRERAERGPIAVAQAGPDLLFVFGPARVTPGGWTSAGDCTLARRWIHEIAAAK